ncbi:HDOD domain-containing protein [Shewanella sp. D64]|uniref:HDOD domain-containing protein n=1 Tax=unclassified Shewanella TaxID=196818 RepID=UPI0022BA6E06|nr:MULTISPECIES: HDOD domain-containing protein [unclassified Shewanella]MEC4728654.1 HDOD domain-containing protein [Shewanella sp. D64]MEC4740583.1 HDOD domain-containing protein [Shewanella sp. E94]WBJ98300.1 HDOD domain-containing protein [Shewanella sp. MTB7]
MGTAALLSHIDKLPRLPKAVSELLDVVNDDSASIAEVSEKISRDPLVSARILRLANSAHYGRCREVGSIDEAVVRLGQQTLRTLVIASAVIGAIPTVAGIDIGEFWGRSFEVSLYGQELAKRCGAEPETAFTCGILHDIGDLLIATIEPDKSLQIRASVADGGDKPEIEQGILGYTSSEVASLLAQNWQFSSELVQGIKYQHNPKAAEPFSSQAGILKLSHIILLEWDGVDENEKTCWLSQQVTSVGLKMEMDGLSSKIQSLRGKGFEIAGQLT